MALLLLILYGVVLCVLSLVSLNRYVLVGLTRQHGHRRDERAEPLEPDALPYVTVQLPIYNERHVAERLIRSACELEYPHDRLEIQILDDSTDQTLRLTRRLARHYRARGVNVVWLHREDRTGFKSGALQHGLERARGEFVAVFDADFIVPRDFLRRTLPFFRDEKVGIVQARWAYVNDEDSALTRATAIGLDAEFAIEQPARCWGGLFLTFNGTAGIIRVRGIHDAGGWQHDTITEDLDLSYRMQLVGWRIHYVYNVTCESELPADMDALKAQQFRWTKGTQQTARKMLPRLWREDLPFWIKLQGTTHLLANSTHPFLLLAGILNPVIVWIAHDLHMRIAWPIAAYFLFSLMGTISYHGQAERYLHADWKRRVRHVPYFLGQAIGLSVNNARAAIEAWLGKTSPFVRTPKNAAGHGKSARGRRYRSPRSWSMYGELALGSYTVAAGVLAIYWREYGALPFLVLFAFGYLLVGFQSLRLQFADRGEPRPPVIAATGGRNRSPRQWSERGGATALRRLGIVAALAATGALLQCGPGGELSGAMRRPAGDGFHAAASAVSTPLEARR